MYKSFSSFAFEKDIKGTFCVENEAYYNLYVYLRLWILMQLNIVEFCSEEVMFAMILGVCLKGKFSHRSLWF